MLHIMRSHPETEDQSLPSPLESTDIPWSDAIPLFEEHYKRMNVPEEASADLTSKANEIMNKYTVDADLPPSAFCALMVYPFNKDASYWMARLIVAAEENCLFHPMCILWFKGLIFPLKMAIRSSAWLYPSDMLPKIKEIKRDLLRRYDYRGKNIKTKHYTTSSILPLDCAHAVAYFRPLSFSLHVVICNRAVNGSTREG
ncbi:hypothetical protein BDQ17DRAFT_1368904 [Cyathus striatus]|nr:hypothetical protein BDQ17DRAFT_1368904 [Cyathus striatus]